MGHRVYGHENKCGHLHGHNYVAFFTAEAEELDDKGRVIDFAVLKQQLGKWIDNNWDHGMVLFNEDPVVALMKHIPDVPGGKQKKYLMPYNPTAENIAKYLGEKICPMLFEKHPIKITRIVIHETENCFATWEL